MMAEPRPLLEVRDLSKSFGGVHAVQHLDLDVMPGESVGLIGPNGAGKSTAIELISGFQVSDSGTVTFDGQQIQGWPPHRISAKGLIRTFQTPREWARLTVVENLLGAAPQNGRERVWKALFQRRMLRETQGQDLVRARELLKQFGLYPLRNEYAGNLSGGQKRLLEFARVAMTSPRLVLLDEPLAGVNPVLQRNILDAIQGLTAQGVATILVEHNLGFVEATCDRVVVMALGTNIASGSMEEVRGDAGVIDAYLGEVEVGV